MDSKIIQQEKRQTNIEEKELFISTIMDNISQIIFWVNNEYKIEGVNRNFLTAYNIKEGTNVIGKKIHIYTVDINPKDHTIFKIKEVFQSKKTINNYIQYFEIVTAYKLLKLWVRQNYIPLFNSDKEIIGVLVTTADITQEKLDQTQLQKYNQQLISSYKELEQFAYIASHDLKTPLSIIINFIQLLKKKTFEKLNTEEHQLINYIVESAHNMEQLVNAIFEISTISEKENKLQAFYLFELIETIQVEMLDSLKAKNVSLCFNSIKDITIIADKLRIKKLLKNLVDNAIKFSKEGIKPIVKISCIENINYWRIRVEDNGLGFKEEYKDKIFKFFQQLQNKSLQQGTGIGLSISKKIVQLHEGTIWAESELGKGSVFFFTIKKKNVITKQEKLWGNFH